jgi:transposase
VCNCKLDGDARRGYPSDLSDAVWAVLQPLMPVLDARKGGTRRRHGDRLVLDAIFFVLRSGCQCRMIPRDLLPWNVAYRWYRTWQRDGTWDRIHGTLRDLVHCGRWPRPRAVGRSAGRPVDRVRRGRPGAGSTWPSGPAAASAT